MNKRLIFAAALLSGSLAGTKAAPQQPIFRSGVDSVTVEVTVLDRGGRPMPALRPDDFTPRVDGETRRVVSAEFIPQAGFVRASLRARACRRTTAPTSTSIAGA